MERRVGMVRVGKQRCMKTRSAWRAWLGAHQATEPELWLILDKKHTGKASLAYEEAKRNGQWDAAAGAQRPIPEVSFELIRALAPDKAAQRHFKDLVPSYRKQFIWWVANAKREATRLKRIAKAVRLLTEKKKLGMR